MAIITSWINTLKRVRSTQPMCGTDQKEVLPMSREKNKSAKVPRRRAEDLLEVQSLEPRREKQILMDRFLKLKTPVALSIMKDIVDELDERQTILEIQNDELQLARADLELLLEQYTDLYESAPAGYLTLNRIGKILQVNSAGARLLGMERTQLLNQHLHRFMATVSQAKFNAFLERIYNNHCQEILVFEQQREEDKFIFHIEGRKSIEREDIIAALIDITAEKEAELLREEEQRLRIIFENVTNGILLCGPDGKLITGNQAAKSILGLTLNEMQSMSLTEIFSNAIHEDGKVFPGDTKTFINSLHGNKATQSVTMGCETQQSTNYTWIEVTALTVKMPDEDKAQVLISFYDITSQKNLVLYNTLTEREKEIFQLIVRGYERKVVSEYLDISPKTVDKHRENLMEKLNMYVQEELIQFQRSINRKSTE